MDLLIRADANKEIGNGHLMRCLALGQLLQDKGYKIHFVTKTINEDLIKRLKKENFYVHTIDENLQLEEDAKITVEIGENIPVKWIITDGYEFTTDYQKIIKNADFKLMCIDDIAKFHFASDIILNQNLNAENIFKYSCEPNTKLLLGTDYILLRREYRMLNNYSRNIKRECRNILVTFGGGDTEIYLSKILESLNLITTVSLNVKVLFGIESEKCNNINDLVKASNHNIELLKTQDNIIQPIQWCDFAISGAGSTVWELAMLKTPVILMAISDNQVPIAEELVKRESAIVIDKNGTTDLYVKTISDFCLDYKKRVMLSDNISYIIKTNFNKLIDLF